MRIVGIAALAFLAGCPGRGDSKRNKTPTPIIEPDISIAELRQELESTMLENLGQLTLGNIETYADGLRSDVPVTLLGLANDGSFIGDGRDSAQLDRWPLAEHAPRFLSKNLDLHVSREGEVGWTYDEVSLRVRVGEHWASLPVRLTALFVRDVDRWVLAMDHWSYPVAPRVIAQGSRDGSAITPVKLPSRRAAPSADTLISLIGRLENGDRRIREQRLSKEEGALVLLPGPEGEYREASISAAPTLAELFEGAQTIGIRDYRVESSASGGVAWMATNLVVRGRLEEPYEIVLRATYVFEHSKTGWRVVQTHISTPVAFDYFEELLFGAGEGE